LISSICQINHHLVVVETTHPHAHIAHLTVVLTVHIASHF
jgi:hypothetical protein